MACSDQPESGNPSAWHIANLYDCDNSTLFIPYQLWTGMSWDGNKDAPCMHPADTLFHVNGVSSTTIRGPRSWTNTDTGSEHTVWFREKVDGSKQQYFTCHPLGIGRVYDSRGGGRSYPVGRCKFPAGYGWQVGVQRRCENTAIEITRLELDADNNLSALEFKWWYRNSTGAYILDHMYRYEPNVGSVNSWKQ